MTLAVVALGSNLGARAEFLDAAVSALGDVDGFRVVRVSPWYESIAHTLNGPDASLPRYLNGVIQLDSSHSARDTLRLLLQLETLLGRPSDHGRWTERTIDLDLIMFGDLDSDEPDLTLPHPHAHERVFVLQPWNDIDPDAELPGFGSVADLLAHCPADERAALTPLGAGR